MIRLFSFFLVCESQGSLNLLLLDDGSFFLLLVNIEDNICFKCRWRTN